MTSSPKLEIAAELARAALDVALLAPRTVAYLARRRSLRAELDADLQRTAEVEDATLARGRLPARPLTVFVACAEASGELHAVSAVRALRRELEGASAPAPALLGLGGSRLEAQGVELVGRPVDRAAMGLGAAASLPYYLKLLADCARAFERSRPDVVLMVDSPALHVPLGHVARRHRLPVAHFVTPQYWGWAPWRVGGYRAAVDLALSILPFEKPWFDRRGVACRHVGHPLLDALPPTPPAIDDPARTRLALLPGSRRGVIARNLPWMLARVEALCARERGLEVVLPHDHPELEHEIAGPVRALNARLGRDAVRIELGGLHRSLATARAALSVSGTVLLDLLHHRLPTVVVYRLGHAHEAWLARRLLTAPYFASINLLAAGPVVPEFCFAGEGPREQVEQALLAVLVDPSARAAQRAGLEVAARHLGPPGACARAVRHALALVAKDGAR